MVHTNYNQREAYELEATLKIYISKELQDVIEES